MGAPPVNCARSYTAGSRAYMSALVRMVENRPSACAGVTRDAPPRPTVGTAAFLMFTRPRHHEHACTGISASLRTVVCVVEQLGRVSGTLKQVLLGHWHTPTCGRLPLATVGAAPPVRCALTNDCCRKLMSVCFSMPAVSCVALDAQRQHGCGKSTGNTHAVKFPLIWETPRTVDEVLGVCGDAVLAAVASSFGLLWPPRPPEAHGGDSLLWFPLTSPRLGQGNARRSAPCALPRPPPSSVRQGPQQVVRRRSPEQGQGGASGWLAARGRAPAVASRPGQSRGEYGSCGVARRLGAGRNERHSGVLRCDGRRDTWTARCRRLTPVVRCTAFGRDSEEGGATL